MTEKAASSGRAANPPTGTVTFLFTDIEGSTSLWEKDPQRMQLALTRHDRIMRSAIEEHEGYVFKTVGDAFCAAFKTAREALWAALSAQRALLAEGWETDAAIRVRMALHTGVAEERDGDYFGPPVNRVARLESAGHGGQVLLSAVTYGLVRDALSHLEPGAELKDLGEHRLRDLRFAERIYQLIAPDLPKDFPALKTLDTRSDERYGLKKLLGSGGMAEVYLAHDKELDRDVAFKVLKNQYSEDEQFVERFEREAKSAASLAHPNIAAVYDRGKTEDGAHYMVMECVTGGNLKERIEKEGSLPPGEAVSVAQQVAEALRAAHERGVIHRDIKPQNILMTESGQAKVADFGIAWAASSSTLTKTGFVVGTAHYLSPEQALGQPASPRSDLYSLGVVLYEMLTGELPHDAETPVSIAMKHVSGRFRPPKEVNPHVPEGLNALTVRLLAREPEERYQDAGELVGDLERVGQGRPPAFVSRQPAAKPAEGSTRPPVAPLPPTEEEAREAAGPHDDRYSRIRYLGGGGMAEVYLARDRELDRDVAFKVLRKQYTEDEQFVERFKREARNAASLNHPNIVSIHDRGETKDGAYYMVMEYVSGGTLKERILKEQTLPAPEAASVAQQVAEALRAAHERGVIHRDIKPQNILMTESGEAKVADFGIARAASSSTVTKTGSIMGTAHYLSPEQALGNPATPRSDLYSLGVVLYEMLTGELPHDAETPIGIAMKHVSGHLRPPKEVNPNVPEGLNALTVRLLAKDPAERYTDADALIADLERVRRGELPAAVATAQGEVPNGAAGTVAEPPDGRGAGGQPRQGEAIRVSPAEQETVPNRETARPSHTPQNSSLRNKKKVLLLAGVIGILLVLLASGGAMALTDIGPVANLFGGLERQPADEGSAAQSPDTQKGAAAGEKSTEETSSPSDNSTASQKSAGPEAPASGSPGQAPASQPTAKQDSPPPTVEIPDLAGRTRSEASSKLTDVGLKLGNQNEASDDKVPEGKISGQNPAAGTKAEPDSTVDITISSGPPQISVPNLVGLSVSDATSKLTAEGLTLGTRKEAPSDNVTPDRVISQDPAPGTKAKQGSPVRLTISSGPQKGKVSPPPPPPKK